MQICPSPSSTNNYINVSYNKVFSHQGWHFPNNMPRILFCNQVLTLTFQYLTEFNNNRSIKKIIYDFLTHTGHSFACFTFVNVLFR